MRSVLKFFEIQLVQFSEFLDHQLMIGVQRFLFFGSRSFERHQYCQLNLQIRKPHDNILTEGVHDQ